jgi:Bax protein
MVDADDVPDAQLENIALPAAGPPITEKTATSLLAASTSKLYDVFKHLGYDLESVREHGRVPRVFLAALPPDMPKISSPDERKRVFIKMMLPLVLHVNEVIAHDRERILALRKEFKRDKALSIADGEWLSSMAAGYGLGADADFDELLRRVDVIPASLAVAQAAVESGWGTSRYAHEGKALFGQYTFKEGSEGLTPREREGGKTHKIKSFESLVDAVKAYATNLNTNPAYEGFRKSRAQMRGKGLDPDGHDLAETLLNYSELRESYVKSLRRIIDSNELSRFDDVRLSSRLAL